jgi:glycosyltransferase involved in cell wall biosynthesis
MNARAQIDGINGTFGAVAIGVHLHAEPERLRETLAALEAHTPAGFDLLLLPDGPDEATAAALVDLGHIRQSATDRPRGAAACLNRLRRETDADILVLLESGTLVGPGWLERLIAALEADPRHGLASPSTNRNWNQLAAFPGAAGDAASIARTAAAAQQRFGPNWKSLAPLWDVGDFCLTIRRAVLDSIGEADEGYDQGPCWEMDLAVRAVRAGWLAVWAQGAFVWRHPFTDRREGEEAARFEASRRRYQDKFCGQILSGARTDYVRHCRGELCPHFAPLATSRNAPLVTCIMPTCGRPEWVGQAIRYFQRQDYPNLELVIIDASPDDALAPLPDDPRIRRERITAGVSIGAMRNRACELARGEIVVHWDDDDWYAPSRVSAQVKPILEGEADITGLTDTRFFELDSWRFWRCTPQLHRRLFVQDVHGGTLAFRRSLHGARCRYPELSLAEDAWFLHQAVTGGARLIRVAGADLFVYLRHGENAWRFPCGTYLDAKGWREDAEPDALAPDRAFYAHRSPAMPAASPLPAEIAAAAGEIVIGVHVHAEPHRLAATLAALQHHTPYGVSVRLLPDGPDSETLAALARLTDVAQCHGRSSGDAPAGAAACFNRLARETEADTLILLESGTIVSPGWLDRLLAPLAADPLHGLASPSTNRAWNQLAAFPNCRGTAADITRAAEDARLRFGGAWKRLAPLWDVGDFCLAVRRSVVEAIGPADEGYRLGPCWELDYAVRAARAGYVSVWAQGAFVFRHPPTHRRQVEEAAGFEASRRRYQDKFCGLLLSGARTTYAGHCRGELCPHFAPPTRSAAVVLSPPPFVSCIMPTANRRSFVPEAIAQFLAQDYPAKELIVFDDGEDAVEDLSPAHPAVRYVRKPRHRSLGAKRNAACELACGDIILHWDDDDWYAPYRIRAQVDALSRSGAEICGIDKVLFYDPRAPSAWEYTYPPGGAPWVYGATLCYRRDFWRAHPFADVTVGEDNVFAGAARPGEICVMPDNRFFVALVHSANTSPKQVRDPRWRPCDVAAVRELVGESWPRG